MKKKFLLVLPISLLIGCIAQPTKNDGANPKIEKKIALELYSLHDDLNTDYTETLKKISEMGFAAVEADSYINGKFYNRSPKQFKKDIEENGMTVLSSHVNRELSNKELASKDLSNALKWWDKCVEDHLQVGAKYIVASEINVPKNLQDLKTYCEYFDQIGKKCKEKGLAFGYHNKSLDLTNIEGEIMYDYMLANTNPDYVFFQIDVYWMVRCGKSPVDYFKKYSGRFKLLHIKDDKEIGQSGMVGFDAILKNIEIAGMEYLIIEVDNYNYTPLESVKMSLDYLLNNYRL